MKRNKQEVTLLNTQNKIGKVELLPHQVEAIKLSDKKNFDLSSAGTGKTY